jgi:hypothetical protein
VLVLWAVKLACKLIQIELLFSILAARSEVRDLESFWTVTSILILIFFTLFLQSLIALRLINDTMAFSFHYSCSSDVV